ncbi:hypothetical protein GSI_04517 [Ganoderma sinense ZZ0214-1]|uniref:BTB domain-containing protein n=1 Tax=Ganoderma sinense ZZ0214-1 TaxID=1077348 RepID=A0A2G8SHM7_9APHY|nr:hypothetical protein GSI_04517 [Ganoderma sinense ZZ0214-1]
MQEELSRKPMGSDSIADDVVTVPTGSLDKAVATSRDPDYWFDDGNLILVPRGVAFRVYKGLLAEHSMIFRSMFHVAQAVPASEDLVEGCPVVPLDDCPNELRELFKLIFPLSSNLKFHGPKVDIAFISNIIRLDHKYELQSLYGEAMHYLTSYYTSSFDAWEDGRHAALWQPDPIHAIRAIGLARLTGTPSILPTAFYICATLGPDIVHGCPPDGGGGGPAERLAPDDLRAVLELKARLATENARAGFLLLRFLNIYACQPCVEVWRRILEQAARAEDLAPHAVASERALDSWTANADCLPVPAAVGGNGNLHYAHMPSSPPHTLCAACRNRLQVRDRELRREIWRRLPEFLGLTIENWDA